MEKNLNAYSSEKVVNYYGRDDVLQKPEETIISLLKEPLRSMKMLDIGTGGGRTTKYFAPLVKEYFGIDYSEKMVDACKHKFPNLQFSTADARNLSNFTNQGFDFILFSFNGIDYISHDDRITAMRQIKNVLKPSGYFCFSSHNIQAVNKWNSIEFSLNPFALYNNITHHYKRIAANKFNVKKIKETAHRDYAILNDGAHDWQLQTHYIKTEFQLQALKEMGYSNIKVFSLKEGKELKDKEIKNCKDNWLYYLCC